MKRYVLLKDNRIIDTDKYVIEQEKCLDGCIRLYTKRDKTTGHYSLYCTIIPYDIVKQSDNILELIDIGDLLNFKMALSNFYGIVNTVVKNKNKCVVFVSAANLYEDDIFKIYKPNKNRGYDLAWERDGND